MKEGQKLWTRDELVLAINLYHKLPFGKMHNRTPEIQELARIIGRTPASVARKLGNFASFDPTLRERGVMGLSNASKLDNLIWNEFQNEKEDFVFESEKQFARAKHTTIEKVFNIQENELPREGMTREQMVKVRVNQAFFRSSILASYNNTCCITGIKQNELLIAGHIKPWGIDEKNRLNPQNGIAINALHDRAFETGLITISSDFKVKISSVLKSQNRDQTIQDYFLKYDNRPIILPSKYLPDKEFLDYHFTNRFIK